MRKKKSDCVKPTKEQIRRTIEAQQYVELASGYSSEYSSVWVKNYADTKKYGFPKFGKWKSFAGIKKSLKKKIDERFPSVAFPFLRLGKITLYERNEEDIEYLREIGDYDADD